MFEAYEGGNKPTITDAIHHEQAINWPDEPLDNDKQKKKVNEGKRKPFYKRDSL